MFIPYGEWLPDQPDFNNPGASTVMNVLPLTMQSYAPLGAPAQVLGALDARCQGAVGARDSSSNSYNIAGTGAKLYKATSASSSWSDISISGGYSAAVEEQWRFAQMSDTFLACEINDPIQSFVFGSSSAFADLASAAPKCRYMAISRGFLMT